MKKAKVLLHPTKKLEKLVGRFSDSKRFSHLMDAIELAVKSEIQDCNSLLTAWADNESLVKAQNPLNRFSKLLPNFFISYSSPPSNKKRLEITLSEVKRTFDLLENMMAGVRERDEKFGQKYLWFEPVRMLGDYIEQSYPKELNPGVIIARYLKNIFADKKEWSEDFQKINQFLEGDCIIWQKDKGNSILYKSNLHFVIESVGLWAITHSVGQDSLLKIAFRHLLDPQYNNFSSQNIKIEKIIAELLFYAPNDFFNAWFEWWLDPGEDFENRPELTLECFKWILLSCPFGRFHKALSVYENTNKETIIQSQKKRKSYSNENFLNYDIFWALSQRWNEAFGEELDKDTSAFVKKIITNYTHDRRKYFNGLSLYDHYWAGNIYLFLSLSTSLNFSDIDFTLMLSFGQFEFGDLYLFEYGQKDFFEKTEEIHLKQEIYIILFQKAIEEGWPELGNALLSLFLFATSLFTQGRLTSLSTLEPIIRKGLSLPGNKTLKHTIKLLIEIIEELHSSYPDALLVKQILNNYIPDAPKLHILKTGKTSSDDKEVEKSLKDSLTEKRIKKLSLESWESMKSAEVLWKKCAMQFGLGIQEWGGLIGGYCKVIEKELVDRLKMVHQSIEYKNYIKSLGKISQKPTSGSILWLLKNYENLPIDLQKLIEKSGVKTYKNNNLIKKLNKLIQGYRNEAFHDKTFDMVRYAQFRKMYFNDKLIHEFIDSLN